MPAGNGCIGSNSPTKLLDGGRVIAMVHSRFRAALNKLKPYHSHWGRSKVLIPEFHVLWCSYGIWHCNHGFTYTRLGINSHMLANKSQRWWLAQLSLCYGPSSSHSSVRISITLTMSKDHDSTPRIIELNQTDWSRGGEFSCPQMKPHKSQGSSPKLGIDGPQTAL